jgi:hypothetical protein
MIGRAILKKLLNLNFGMFEKYINSRIIKILEYFEGKLYYFDQLRTF